MLQIIFSIKIAPHPLDQAVCLSIAHELTEPIDATAVVVVVGVVVATFIGRCHFHIQSTQKAFFNHFFSHTHQYFIHIVVSSRRRKDNQQSQRTLSTTHQHSHGWLGQR